MYSGNGFRYLTFGNKSYARRTNIILNRHLKPFIELISLGEHEIRNFFKLQSN
ncbi:hypothetical protein ATE84_4068 [Aquimarina sp. MAR_2010_214]|nr:hypothetical protein ATE84_4068 [Aquimarina sp. MAR_2010_214]